MSALYIKNRDDLNSAVAEFLANGGKIQHVIPGAAGGNEQSRGTQLHVAKVRRGWRKANKEQS